MDTAKILHLILNIFNNFYETSIIHFFFKLPHNMKTPVGKSNPPSKLHPFIANAISTNAVNNITNSKTTNNSKGKN